MNPFLLAVDILREDGWYQGAARGADGSRCAVSALSEAASRLGLNSQMVVKAAGAAVRQVASGFWGVAGFNDDPSTTFEDVKLALKHGAELWEERGSDDDDRDPEGQYAAA